MWKWKQLEILNSKTSSKWTSKFHGIVSIANAFLEVWGREAVACKADWNFKEW